MTDATVTVTFADCQGRATTSTMGRREFGEILQAMLSRPRPGQTWATALDLFSELAVGGGDWGPSALAWVALGLVHHHPQPALRVELLEALVTAVERGGLFLVRALPEDQGAVSFTVTHAETPEWVH